MLIGIIILICAITVVYVFRRHGNSLGLQQGKDTLSLPVIEFEDKDEYGDELRAEINKAYHDMVEAETCKNIKEAAKLEAIKNYNSMRDIRTTIYDDTNDRLKFQSRLENDRLRASLLSFNPDRGRLTNYL